eukprot:145235-Lingulodinium_polyedra.AAC.1
MLRLRSPSAATARASHARSLQTNAKTGVRMECVKRAICGGVFGCCSCAASALLGCCFGAAWVE